MTGRTEMARAERAGDAINEVETNAGKGVGDMTEPMIGVGELGACAVSCAEERERARMGWS